MAQAASDYYYAYGSNMSTARLTARIDGIDVLGAARIQGYRLRCNKRGADGSGKANLVIDAGATAWGVLFRLPDHTWTRLDGFEVGYQRRLCRVEHTSLGALDAQVYLAAGAGLSELAPFDWYLAHMLTGAREHALPGGYIEALERWSIVADPQRQRGRRAQQRSG